MSRLISIAPGEYYHIYNRGVGKKNIFHTDGDRARFIFLLLILQAPVVLKNMSRLIKEFSTTFNINSVLDKNEIQNIKQERYLELNAFSLMPNHFHLLVKEHKPGGISKYLQRVLTAYTMYYNIRNETTGHLFQGPYKIVHIKDDSQLMHCSAYIHRNPLEIGCLLSNLHNYKWSSYCDYIGKDRWDGLLERSILLERFTCEGEDTYENFIKTSPAKSEFDFENIKMEFVQGRALHK